MRPRSYARKPTDAHTSSRTHPRAHTYIHPCTHTYARIRAREGNFLTPNLLYSITKPSSIISDTIHFYYPITVQSISILAPHWLYHLYKPLPYVTHLPLIYHPFAIIFYLPTIYQLLVTHPSLITLHHLARVIFHLYLISISTNSPSYQYVSML